MPPTNQDTELEDQPASVESVHTILVDAEGGLTQKEIIKRALCSRKTVRKALAQLEAIGMIESRPFLGDARQTVYKSVRNSSRT